MDEPTSRDQIFESIRSEREKLESALEHVSHARMSQPGVEAAWSVKDILAHIVDWEQRMARWIDESLRGEVPERPAPGMTWDDLDRLNEMTYMKNKDKGIDDVLAEFSNSYRHALETVEKLSEADMFNVNRFEWRQGDPMWHMVAANTWWHYKDHAEAITEWSRKGD